MRKLLIKVLLMSCFASSIAVHAQVTFGQVDQVSGPTKEAACSAALQRAEKQAQMNIDSWKRANRKGLDYKVGECSCQENLSGADRAPPALKYFCKVNWRLVQSK